MNNVQLKSNVKSLNLYHGEMISFNGTDEKNHVVHIYTDELRSSLREDDDGIFTTMACWHCRYSLGDDIGGIGVQEFWQSKVRELLSAEEQIDCLLAGKIDGVRLEKSDATSDGETLYNVYELTAMETILGRSEATEDLVAEGALGCAVFDLIADDLSTPQLMEFLTDELVALPLWLYDHSGITMSCGERVYPYNDRWDSGLVGWICASKKDVLSHCILSNEEEWRDTAIGIMQAEVEMYDHYLCGEVFGFVVTTEDDDEDDESADSCWGFYGSDVLASGLAEAVGLGLEECIRKGEYAAT